MSEQEPPPREAILAAESERVRGLLRRYLSPRVAEAVLAERHDAQRVSQACVASILLCDLRGFTGYAERRAPLEVAETLNEFLEAMTQAVFKYDGVLDKYTGDGLLAVFGAPYPQPDHAERAIYAALEMHARHEVLLGSWRGTAAGELRMGIGIATGEVLAGNFGSAQRVDYTVIGHVVNLAARLTGIAPGGSILTDESTRAAVERVARLEALGPAHLKNVSQSVSAFRLLGVEPGAVLLCLGCGRHTAPEVPVCAECGTPRGAGMAAAAMTGGLLTAAAVRSTLTALHVPRGPHLIAIAGPHQGLDLPVSFPCAIGREALTNSLTLSLDGAVSRRHAVLRLADAGEVTIVDLDSQNGTYHNGERVTVATVQDGDILTLGRTSLVVSGLGSSGRDAPATTRSSGGRPPGSGAPA